MAECKHPTLTDLIRWGINTNSIIASCRTCGAEVEVPVEWDEAEWGDG